VGFSVIKGGAYFTNYAITITLTLVVVVVDDVAEIVAAVVEVVDVVAELVVQAPWLLNSGELGESTFWIQKRLLDRFEARFGIPTCELVC
jgi:hypothetical protein